MTCTVSPVSTEHPYPAAFRCVGVASLPYGGVVEVEALARVRDV